MWVAWVGSLSWEDPKEKGEATHSSILAWRIPCSVEPMGSQRVGHDWATWLLLTSHSAVAQKRGVSAPSRHPERMPKPCLYSVGQRPAAPRKKTSMRRGRNNHARQGKTWTRTAQGRCVFPTHSAKKVYMTESGAGLFSSDQIFFLKSLCIEMLGFFWLEVSPVQNCSGPEN